MASIFSLLNSGRVKVASTLRIVVGDGRLSLQKTEVKQSKCDLILVDAFTGDGIPVHLLTREAIELNMSHLAEDVC